MRKKKVSTENTNTVLSSIYEIILEGGYEFAIKELNEYLVSELATPQIYTALSYCYFRLFNFTESKKFAEKALKLDSNYRKAKLLIEDAVVKSEAAENYELYCEEPDFNEESVYDYLIRLHQINLDQINRDYYLPTESSITPDPDNGLFEGSNLEEDWQG